MRIEEQAVGSPRVGFDPLVQIFEFGSGREFATVFVLDVLDVSCVLNFGVINPRYADGD